MKICAEQRGAKSQIHSYLGIDLRGDKTPPISSAAALKIYRVARFNGVHLNTPVRTYDVSAQI